MTRSTCDYGLMDRVLDRVAEFDEQSRNYPIRALLEATKPRSYTWPVKAVLDQGSEGACVGYAWAHEALAVPNVRQVDSNFARQLYAWAQRNDQWPGENYSGTSVLAGAKAMKEHGLLKEYRWCFGLQDVLITVSRKNPVVLGIDWHEGMWDTDENGLIHATGRVVGGHAILARGVSIKRKTVRLHNSWGPGWGVNGTADISWDDLDRLLHAQGDACVPILR